MTLADVLNQVGEVDYAAFQLDPRITERPARWRRWCAPVLVCVAAALPMVAYWGGWAWPRDDVDGDVGTTGAGLAAADAPGTSYPWYAIKAVEAAATALNTWWR